MNVGQCTSPIEHLGKGMLKEVSINLGVQVIFFVSIPKNPGVPSDGVRLMVETYHP